MILFLKLGALYLLDQGDLWGFFVLFCFVLNEASEALFPTYCFTISGKPIQGICICNPLPAAYLPMEVCGCELEPCSRSGKISSGLQILGTLIQFLGRISTLLFIVILLVPSLLPRPETSLFIQPVDFLLYFLGLLLHLEATCFSETHLCLMASGFCKQVSGYPTPDVWLTSRVGQQCFREQRFEHSVRQTRKVQSMGHSEQGQFSLNPEVICELETVS